MRKRSIQFRKNVESSINLRGFPVPPEPIANLSPCESFRMLPKRLNQFVCYRIAKPLTKDVPGGGFAVFPQGKGGHEMVLAYDRFHILQGIQTRYPHHLGLSPAKHGPKKSGLAFREDRVNLPPDTPRSLIPFQFASSAAKLDGLAKPVNNWLQRCLIERSPLR